MNRRVVIVGAAIVAILGLGAVVIISQMGSGSEQDIDNSSVKPDGLEPRVNTFIEDSEAAAAEEPDPVKKAAILASLAREQSAQGDIEGAVKNFNESLSLSPSGITYNGLAYAYFLLKDADALTELKVQVAEYYNNPDPGETVSQESLDLSIDEYLEVLTNPVTEGEYEEGI